MLLNLRLGFIILSCCVIAVGTAYLYGRLQGSNDCDARHALAAAEDFRKRTEDAEIRSSFLEIELASTRDFSRTLERQVYDEISRHSIYSSCVLPTTGLLLLNSTLKTLPTR